MPIFDGDKQTNVFAFSIRELNLVEQIIMEIEGKNYDIYNNNRILYRKYTFTRVSNTILYHSTGANIYLHKIDKRNA